jgi:hypothetical protein
VEANGCFLGGAFVAINHIRSRAGLNDVTASEAIDLVACRCGYAIDFPDQGLEEWDSLSGVVVIEIGAVDDGHGE